MAYEAASMSRLASAAQRSMRHHRKPKASGDWSVPESSKLSNSESAGDRKWEFDRQKLTDLREIGSGNFGKVFLGVAHGLISGQEKTPVAIKTLTSTGKDAESNFLAEVSIMQQIDGPHHIVRLLGVCTDAKPMYMIMEFMGRGDLKEVLRHARPRKNAPSEITPTRMAKMCSDVAEGMAYLSRVHIVHRDLAARNCLVDENYTVKVGDFGLTRDVYHAEYYRMTGSAALPIRWMSPESLNDGVFSTASDVWSFGVVMWEVVTFGKVPYPDLENSEVVDAVCDEGHRMSCPENCPKPFYDVMFRCWAEEPQDRPTFQQLYDDLNKLTPKLSEKPILRGEIKKKKEKQKAVTAPTYDQPQDALTFTAEDSAEEEEYKPYGLSSIDMSTYALVGPDKSSNGPLYDLATDRSVKQAPEDDGQYELASSRSSKPSASKPTATPTTPAVIDPTPPPPVPANPPSPKEERPYVRRGATTDIAANETIAWIEGVLGIKKPSQQSLQDWLKSGEILCDLVNKKKPNTISRINRGSKRAFMQMENIATFLEACKTLGISSRDRFETVDLFEDDNLTPVVNCLVSLRVLLG